MTFGEKFRWCLHQKLPKSLLNVTASCTDKRTLPSYRAAVQLKIPGCFPTKFLRCPNPVGLHIAISNLT